MTNKEYNKFKILLSANNDDRSVGMEALKNIDSTLIQKILLGKYLSTYRRHEYVKEFPEIEKYLVPWNDLFPIIKKLKPDALNKELVEQEFLNSCIDVIKEHHSFVSEIKIQLKW